MENGAELRRAPIGIAGAGRVGFALAALLHSAGEPVVAIASRSSRRAASAATRIGEHVVPVAYRELRQHAQRLIIAVPDGAITGVAEELAASGTSGIALHTSGTLGPEALAPLRARGFACGTLHPLQTITGTAEPVRALSGVAFSVSGDAAAIEWAESIAALCGGTTLRIPPEARPVYHAAAVMASNYITALIDAAASLMERAGVEREKALAALGPLVRTSAENAIAKGPLDALTGPIERGDVATVAVHIAALGRCPATVLALYKAAGLHTLSIARRKNLGSEQADRIEQQLNRE